MRLALLLLLAMVGVGEAEEKKRLFVVSSYHRTYLWSQATHRGLGEAMLKYGYLDHADQIDALARHDQVESRKAIVKKAWMNTKFKHSLQEIGDVTLRIMKMIEAFEPDLVLLGDDNAANYIGNQLLDTPTPVVFWGINGLPLKYDLIDSMDHPGHNITGVWQAGFHRESVDLLHRLVPTAKTFAILACDSVTARPNIKQLKSLAKRGKLALQLVDVVSTNSFTTFKRRALELVETVDAFYVLNHDTLKDDQGRHVDMLTVGKWYLTHIRKPEATPEGQFVREGMLLSANDSGYNQAYHAFEMAYDILERGLNPSRMRTKTPPRGPLMVNRQRTAMLGIDLHDKMDMIDELVETAIAIEK